MSGIFAVQILEDFAGGFLGGFSGHFFTQKTRRKNPARKSGGSKIKIHEKSVLPRTKSKKKKVMITARLLNLIHLEFICAIFFNGMDRFSWVRFSGKKGPVT